MTEFYEAAEAFRTAQLMKLTKELQEEKEAHCITLELAVDRGERLIELAKVANELKDESDKLLADSKRLKWMCEGRYYVEYSSNLNAYYVISLDGDCQAGVFDTPEAAIDDMMESENV